MAHDDVADRSRPLGTSQDLFWHASRPVDSPGGSHYSTATRRQSTPIAPKSPPTFCFRPRDSRLGYWNIRFAEQLVVYPSHCCWERKKLYRRSRKCVDLDHITHQHQSQRVGSKAEPALRLHYFATTTRHFLDACHWAQLLAPQQPPPWPKFTSNNTHTPKTEPLQRRHTLRTNSPSHSVYSATNPPQASTTTSPICRKPTVYTSTSQTYWSTSRPYSATSTSSSPRSVSTAERTAALAKQSSST